MNTLSAAQAVGESTEQKIARLERELAAAQAQIAALREFAKHLLVVHKHTEPLVASYIVDEVLRECGK